MSEASLDLAERFAVYCPFLAENFDDKKNENENEQENIGSVEPVYQDFSTAVNGKYSFCVGDHLVTNY